MDCLYSLNSHCTVHGMLDSSALPRSVVHAIKSCNASSSVHSSVEEAWNLRQTGHRQSLFNRIASNYDHVSLDVSITFKAIVYSETNVYAVCMYLMNSTVNTSMWTPVEWPSQPWAASRMEADGSLMEWVCDILPHFHFVYHSLFALVMRASFDNLSFGHFISLTFHVSQAR